MFRRGMIRLLSCRNCAQIQHARPAPASQYGPFASWSYAGARCSAQSAGMKWLERIRARIPVLVDAPGARRGNEEGRRYIYAFIAYIYLVSSYKPLITNGGAEAEGLGKALYLILKELRSGTALAASSDPVAWPVPLSAWTQTTYDLCMLRGCPGGGCDRRIPHPDIPGASPSLLMPKSEGGG